MKKLSLILIAISFVLGSSLNAQTVVAGINPTNLSCGGGNVDLTALGNSTVPVFGDDFNNGMVAPGWAASAAAQFNNPCGASVDGSTYLWMGNGTAAPREMTTAPVDVSCGGTVCFDFKMSVQGAGQPCEGPDLLSEGVALQCSTDGGATWTDFAYFEPGGNIQTTQTTTYGNVNGTHPFTSWANYCFTIPPGCETGNTMFQLHQYGSSGNSYDHWGIDNFYVYAAPCAPYYYDWDHIPGSPDAPDVSTNVTETTTFEVCYTNGINSVCDQVTVTVESIDITSLVIGTEACLGDNTGTVNVTVVGGSAPYNYNLTGPTPSSNGSGNFTNLAPGNYTITITDGGTCVVDSSFVIDPGPACCTVSATSVDALCFGTSTGSATANPANGVAPYTYQWDAGTGNQTTQTANNLPAGNYSVTITDFNGCQSSVNIAVGQPVVLASNATPTDASCNGVCDGQIVISAPTGGTAPYTYNINGGVFGGASTFPGLCAGTYNLITEDDNGCQVLMSNIAINEPTDVTLVEAGTVDATCGASNGELTVTAGGGTPNYQYDIGGAQQASNNFTGLAAGNYVVTVTDDNGCTETVNVTVGSAAGPVPFVDSSAPVTCAGGLNGSVTIGVGGGSAPYQFSLNAGPNQPSNTFALPAGVGHTVTVTDANGCIGSVTFDITEPLPLTYNTVNTDANCNGDCDGQIVITAQNATPPYTYSDDNGLTFQASNTLTGLCAGNVNVVVQDASGCLANSVEVIDEPDVVTSASAFVEPSCHGLSDGEISFVPAGGTPGYTFSVDNGTTFTGANPQLGIAAGTYDIAVEDANGCQFFDQITVTEPPAFDFIFIANNPSNCGANDGSFEIIATNGLAPYTYSIDGGVTTQGGGFFGSLFSGLYELYVVDDNGCADSVFSALSDNIMTTSIDFQFPTTCKSSCDGGAQVSQVNGSPPFTYTINTGGTQGNGSFFALCAGQHFVTIEDNGLCIGIEEINIAEPDTITYTPILTNITCPAGADGQIDFGVVTGGDNGPYTYSIDGGTTFQASPIFAGLTSGTYNLVAMDDPNNCIGTTTVELTEPPAWDVTVNPTDLTCFQNATGLIQIVGGGATAPYTFDLSGAPAGPAAFATYLSLDAINYNITVTDGLGCTFTTTQLLNEPPQLTGAYALTDALCNGSADGEIDVTAGGGTPPYLYSSDNGVIQQTGNVLTGLAAACYDVEIEDDNGCTLVSNECIGEPTQLTSVIATNPATCGNNNGDITITGGNGTPGYMYSNDNGTTFQAGTLFAGLAAGDYNTVVQDLNGCEIDELVTIAADDLPTIDNVATVDPLCFAGLDGSITITSSGGVGAHGYSLNAAGPFNPAATFGGLGDGTYDVYVEDANGCIATQQVQLNEPPLLTIATAGTDLLCNGDFTGEIVLTEGGGTGPYQFSIDNGVNFQGGGTFSFIAAGNYDVMIEDDNGCQATDNIILTEPLVLAMAPAVVDPTCFDDCDGSVTSNVTDGTAPYTYNWSNNLAGNADANATGVCDGTYSLTVTDDNGCQVDANFTLTEPQPVQFPGVVTTDVLCNGDATGTITVGVPTVGVAPFQYSIDGGATFQAGNVFGDVLGGIVGEGNYDIVINDGDGCAAGTNTTIYQPDPIDASVPGDAVLCFGADANIQTFVTGGTQPYNFAWDNNVNANTANTQVFVEAVTGPISYHVVITDDNGCVLDLLDTYNLDALPPLTVDAGPDQLICPGGTANLLAVGAGGALIDFQAYLDYSYSWDTGVAGDTTAAISVSPAVQTTYTITLADECGDVVTDEVIVGFHPDPITDIVGGGDGCAPDTMSFDNPSYAFGSAVLWDFGNGMTSVSPTPTDIVFANPGCYDVTLTSTSLEGCIVTQTYPNLVCIYEDPIPGFYTNPNSPSILDPTVSIVDISTNAEFYSYTFGGYGSSNDAEPTITFPVTEETTVDICQTIISPEGCTASICIPVEIHEEIIFYVPNIFTPDGDLFNETFHPVFTSGVDPYDYHLTMFNRWGEVMFESYNFDEGWNGHYGNGGLVRDGVYIWQIEFGEKLSDKKQTHRGHVTVLK